MNLNRLIIIGTLVWGLAMGNVGAIHITPTYQNFSAKPGKKVNGQMTLTNNEDQKIMIFPETRDWYVLPENEGITSKDWFKFKTKKFALEKGESKVVQFKLKAPRKAQGELVAMASFLIQGLEIESNVNKKMSVAIYLGIDGTQKFESELAAIMVSNNKKENVMTAGAAIKNNGNVHMRPRGLIQIFNENKEKVIANVSISEGRPVYPGRTVEYLGSIKGYQLKSGKYVAHVDLVDVDHRIPVVNESREFLVTQEGKVELR